MPSGYCRSNCEEVHFLQTLSFPIGITRQSLKKNQSKMASTTTFHVIRETDWTRMDHELKTLFKPIQDKLSLTILTSEETAVEFSDTLIATLETFGKDMKPRKGQHGNAHWRKQSQN